MPFIPDKQTASQTSGFVPDQAQAPTTQAAQPAPEVSDSITQNLADIGTGIFHGMDTFATTLLKAGSKAGLIDVPVDAIQASYNDNSAKYNKASERSPYLAGGGNIIGGLIATAPLMATGGGAGLLGKVAVNAAQGVGMGALTTEQGQDPNQILNPTQAVVGGLTGGLLGGAGHVIGTKVGQATALAKAQEAMPGVKVFGTDVVPKTGISAKLNDFISNSVLSKFPSIMGTAGGREAQSAQVEGFIQQYISKLTTDSKAGGPVQLGNIINQHVKEIGNKYNQVWKDFTDLVPNKVIKTDHSKVMVEQLIGLKGQAGSGITKARADMLRTGLKDMTPSQAVNFKREVWKMFDDTAKRGANKAQSPAMQESADMLENLYWNLNDDLKNGLVNIEGSQSAALQAYEKANAFTKGYKGLFDPKTRPQLMKAISDITDESGKVSDFQTALFSKTTSRAEVNQAQKILGQSGSDAAAGLHLQDLFDSSFMTNDSGQRVFNLGNFLGEINKIPKSAQAGLMEHSLESLQGLKGTLENIASAQARLKGGATVQGLGAAAVGTAALSSPAAAALIAATPTVLSTVYRTSPLKNILNTANKIINSSSVTSTVRDYMINKTTKELTKAGIILKVIDGQVTAEHKDESK